MGGRQAHPEIKLDVRIEAFAPWEEKVKVLLASGSAPDAFLVSWAYFRELVELGALLDISSYKDRDYDVFDGGDIFVGAWESVEVDGRHYGIPYTPGQSMLFYNEDLIQSVGLATPDASWTWDDFVRIGRTVSSSSQSETNSRYGIDGSYTHWAFWTSYLFSQGGSVWNESWDEIAINSDAGREMLNFMDEIVNTYQVTPPRGQSIPSDPWIGGRTAFKSANKNWIRLTPDRGGTFELGVLPFPNGPAGQFNPGGVLPVVANATTQHPEAVWTLMKFLLSPEIVQYRLVNEDNLPIRASVVREIEDWRLQTFAANIDLVKPFTTKNYNQMLGIMTTHISLVMDRVESVNEALEAMEVELRAAVQR